MAKLFINRPIVAMVISILMTILGLIAMVQLPTALFPDIAPPEILLRRPMWRDPCPLEILGHSHRAE